MDTMTPAIGEYAKRRAWIAEYFDRTAALAWAQLTSDAPVGRVRQSVRAGRDRMRATLLQWLPEDLTDRRVLDAGCGTGALAVELAQRGAQVVAIDLSPTLVALARDRAPTALQSQLDFRSGDMLDASLGAFDYVVAMDSLIHYRAPEMLTALSALRARTRRSVLFTMAPRTPLLSVVHAIGKVFPRGSRAPAIEPIAEATLRAGVARWEGPQWTLGQSTRIASGFYTSEAWELRRGIRGKGIS